MPFEAVSRLKAFARCFVERPLKLFYLILLTNVAIFAVTSLLPQVKGSLVLSLATPQGILTAIFVHRDLGHLTGNLIGAAYSVFLILCLSWTFMGTGKALGLFERMLAVAFVSAIVANLAEYSLLLLLQWHDYASAGFSGVVYALMGCYIQLLFWVLKSPTVRKNRLFLTLVVLQLGLFVGYIVLFPTEFAGVGPGGNALNHIISFLTAYFVTMIYLNRDSYLGALRHLTTKAPR